MTEITWTNCADFPVELLGLLMIVKNKDSEGKDNLFLAINVTNETTAQSWKVTPYTPEKWEVLTRRNKMLCFMWGCQPVTVTFVNKYKHEYLFTDVLICIHCGALKHD